MPSEFDVIRLVLTQAAKLVLAGTALGLILALTLARVLKNLIYNVSPADPVTFVSVGLMVIFIAVLACYIPALKATRANPMARMSVKFRSISSSQAKRGFDHGNLRLRENRRSLQNPESRRKQESTPSTQ